MSEWITKCEQSKPITREYAKSLVQKHRSASPQVVQSMLGMIMRGDALKSGASDQPRSLPPMPGPDDDTGEGDAEGD